MYKGYGIIDGHVHFTTNISPEYMLEFLDRTGTDMANLAMVYHSRRLSCVPEGLMLKAACPGRFFVYANPDASEYYSPCGELGKNMAAYVRRMLRCGCDGVKLLEGKPQLRKRLPVPDFDEECWRPFWDYAQDSALPMLWHVNDPESFWDKDSVPPLARAQGWFYDENYVNNEAQYAQVLGVLERYPGLKIIFAHFFFMSAQLDRLSEIMDKYPNIMVDITPGIELYENLSANLEGARAFFNKYQDRIVYGTDIGGRCVLGGEDKSFNERENLRRPEIVRQYLTGAEQLIGSDGDFLVDRPDFILRSPGLSREQVQKILSGNFLRFTGSQPRPVDGELVLEECGRIRGLLSRWAEKEPGFSPDYSGLEAAEAFFRRS